MHNENHTWVTIPDDGSVTAGTYYLGMIVDPGNTVAEFDEANNTAGFSIQVEEPTANVDLQPTSLTWPDGTDFSPEASVDITTNVKNFGSDPTGGFTMQIVFSADANFSTYDMLSQWTMTGLDAGIEDTQVHNVTIPVGLADGDYHLGVKANCHVWACSEIRFFPQTHGPAPEEKLRKKHLWYEYSNCHIQEELFSPWNNDHQANLPSQ